MPFTPAHSIAVLPLARKPLVLSALVIGSFSPDFEYFVHLSTKRTIGHTPFGLLAFCVPVGLVVFWLWHNLLKGPLVELLPDAHYRKLKPYCKPVRFSSLWHFLMVCLSLFIGAVTHVSWDTFTHAYSWGVKQFPILQAPLYETQYGELQLHKALQHGCSVIGLLILALLYIRWFRKVDDPYDKSGSPLSVSFRIKAVLGILFSVGLISLILALKVSLPLHSVRALRQFITMGGISSISFMAMGLLVYSIWMKVRTE